MEFEFTIYDTPSLIVNDRTWYLSPVYCNEINILNESFKQGIDFILYKEWTIVDVCDVNEFAKGWDILINDKVFTWLSLKYGQPDIDMFTDLMKYDPTHYTLELEEIIKTIQNVI